MHTSENARSTRWSRPIVLALVSTLTGALHAQTLELSNWTVDGGGGTSTGGTPASSGVAVPAGQGSGASALPALQSQNPSTMSEAFVAKPAQAVLVPAAKVAAKVTAVHQVKKAVAAKTTVKAKVFPSGDQSGVSTCPLSKLVT